MHDHQSDNTGDNTLLPFTGEMQSIAIIFHNIYN